MKRIQIFVLLAALAGCAMPPHDTHSGYYPIPANSVVILAEPLTVVAGQARVFLQGGELRAKARLDVYRPHCNFELRQVSDGSARIEPDRFSVTTISRGDEGVVRRAGMTYAARKMSDGDSPGMVSRYFRYGLHSERQPQVLRLTCHGGSDYPGRAELPTLAEIRQALGRYVGIEPARGV